MVEHLLSRTRLYSVCLGYIFDHLKWNSFERTDSNDLWPIDYGVLSVVKPFKMVWLMYEINIGFIWVLYGYYYLYAASNC